MKRVEIVLDDELIRKLEGLRLELGSELDELLLRAIREKTDELARPRKWMPREEWDALVHGDKCQVCDYLSLGGNPGGYIIANLKISRLDLMKNQYVPGYCGLYCHKHVTEPYHLSMEERLLFFEDMMRAAQAIDKVFRPTKMNYEILGNLGPHLHCHLVPRYHGDPAPGRPIDPYRERVNLSEAEYGLRIKAIKEELGHIPSMASRYSGAPTPNP